MIAENKMVAPVAGILGMADVVIVADKFMTERAPPPLPGFGVRPLERFQGFHVRQDNAYAPYILHAIELHSIKSLELKKDGGKPLDALGNKFCVYFFPFQANTEGSAEPVEREIEQGSVILQDFQSIPACRGEEGIFFLEYFPGFPDLAGCILPGFKR